MSAIWLTKTTKLCGTNLEVSYSLRSLVNETAQDHSNPQRESAATADRGESGQLGHPAQPVAYGVGVDEQQPGRRLQREPLLQVGRDGFDERRAAAEHRLVD